MAVAKKPSTKEQVAEAIRANGGRKTSQAAITNYIVKTYQAEKGGKLNQLIRTALARGVEANFFVKDGNYYKNGAAAKKVITKKAPKAAATKSPAKKATKKSPAKKAAKKSPAKKVAKKSPAKKAKK
mmetsp:Transcript_4317/g.14023  ORF Transcript_4317/g.14023 Transcript_4317/m.14023 type:complete len:127 (-) Transcript_4317:84-464(-)